MLIKIPERRGPRIPRPADTLTTRELEILSALFRGASYQQVATQLGVTINTVRTHVRGIYAKLGASSKTEAVVVALERGLLRVRGS